MSQRDIAKSVVQFNAMQNDVVVTEDYGHGNEDIQNYMLSNDMMDARAAGGTKNICLEYQPQIQKGLTQLNDIGKAMASGKNVPDKYIDNVTDQYAHWMQDNVGRTGMEEGSKAEFESFKSEARSVIYAGEKGMTVHAVDSGKRLEGDGSSRLDGDKQMADKVTEIAKTGKTDVIIGAAHSNLRDGTNGKGIDEHLADNGLKVGKIGVVGNMSDLNTNPAVELPNTVIQTDANRIIPGNQMQVMQMETNGKDRELGGEISLKSPEAQNSNYEKVSEKDLGNLAPPSANASPPKEQSAGMER